MDLMLWQGFLFCLLLVMVGIFIGLWMQHKEMVKHSKQHYLNYTENLCALKKQLCSFQSAEREEVLWTRRAEGILPVPVH